MGMPGLKDSKSEGQEDDARLSGYQSYQYWSSQVVVSTWEALIDCGIMQPLTRKDMKFFKIQDFLEASVSKPTSAFRDYNMKGAEFAPVMALVKQLLVPPRYMKGGRNYPQPWDPMKTRLSEADDETKDDGSYHCEACNIRHTRGQ